MDEDLCMMWLSRSLNLNHKKAILLLERFGKASEIYTADEKLLMGIEGMSEEILKKLRDGKENLAQWIEELSTLGIDYVSINNNKYPRFLKVMTNPPVGLYVKGTLFGQEHILVSMIGARRCSSYGKNMAYSLSKQLAEEGFVIVSGMARGIDSQSHKGALDAGGKTIAVLGFGHKHCYPAENRELMALIAQKGCLISEYPPSTEPLRHMFLQRNRIIAGISEGLIVVEAGEKSGTLSTVDFALEEGRHVMTIPANLTSTTAKGTNELIKQGCPMITNVDDVYFEMGKEKDRQRKIREEKVAVELSTQENKVYELIEGESVSSDKLVERTGLSVQDVQYILTMLELYGLIEKQPGEKYLRV